MGPFSLVSHIFFQFSVCVVTGHEGWQGWRWSSGREGSEEAESQWPEEWAEPPQTQPAPAHSLALRRTEEEEEEELEETAQEKKLRLAKVYLEQLRQQGEPVGWAGEGHGLCPWWVTDAGTWWAAGASGSGCPMGGWP